MEATLINKELYIALSELFIDSQADYEHIASITKSHPECIIKDILFKYVAPACYYNTVGATPSVIYFFDEKDLIDRVLKIKKKRKTKIGRIYYNLISYYLEIRFKNEWETLKKHRYSKKNHNN